MTRSRYALLRLLLPVAFLLLGCPAPAPVGDQLLLSGLGPTIEAGRDVSFLARLQTSGSYEELGGNPLSVELLVDGARGETVFEGETDAAGLVAVNFTAPAALDAAELQLIINVDAPNGTIRQGHLLGVGPGADLLLTTDKPIYQPGQPLHMRVLALERTGLAPLHDAAIELSVTDPAGNLLLVRTVATSEFGIAALDFPLDSRAATGFYQLEARLGASSFATSVEVKPYVLPRFEVTFAPARDGWLPGETVTGTVEARYFFGRPVANAQVELKGFTTDVERVEAVTLAGTTDADGRFAFSFALPETFVVLPTEDETGNRGNRTATLEIELAVTDSAGHTERTEEGLTVAEAPLRIEIVPESGDLVAGLPNLLYIHVADIAGNGVAADLLIAGDTLAEPIATSSDAAGLAVVEVPTPGTRQGVRFVVEAIAQADPEQRGARRQSFWVDTGILLRTDRSEYVAGDTVLVDVAMSQAEAGVEPPALVYLMVSKIGQSRALAPLPLVAGRAEAALQLEGGIVGTLQIQALAGGPFGTLQSDERFILVNVAEAEIAAEFEAKADGAAHRPGDRAVLDVQVASEGAPLQAALGVSIVDESVFALGESDPGFVRSYFLLARALQEPRYGIDGFSDIGADVTTPYDQAPPLFALSPAELAAARQVALAGLFAQELAAAPAAASAAATSATGSAAQTAWGYAARLPWALPLLGVAFYDGTRKRRRLLAVALVLALAAAVLVACAAPAAPAAEAPASEGVAAAMPAGETTGTRGQAQPTRLRQLFPETLLWLPDVRTDAQGAARIEVPIADSITTWRVSLVASDRDGHLGATTIDLPVFQPFFIEPDLPTFFTAGDEVTIPVAIYNYLDAPQVVTVEMAPAAGVEALGASAHSLTVAANEVASVALPVRFTDFGELALRFDATATPEDPTRAQEASGDAVERVVTVRPAGEQRLTTHALRPPAAAGAPLELPVTVEESIDPRASAVTVRVFPNALADVQQGFEALLQAPHGCFEQVTSITYLNVLTLAYLQASGQEGIINEERVRNDVLRGLQQQLAYEVAGEPGGFSWYGDPPAITHLTAYGLMSFADTQRVTWVDPQLLARTAAYLMGRQGADGGWHPEDEGLWGVTSTMMTAQIVWALSAAGQADSPSVQRGIDFLLWQRDGNAPILNVIAPNAGLPAAAPASGNLPPPAPPSPLVTGGSMGNRPAPGQPTPRPAFTPTWTPMWTPTPALVAPSTPLPPQTLSHYEQALAANALLAAGADASPFLEDLAAGINPTGLVNGQLWSAGAGTWSGGYGWVADLETTALAVLALSRAAQQPELVEIGIDSLLAAREPWGTIGNTQTTLYTLMALLEQTEATDAGETTLTLRLAGQERTVILPAGAVEVQTVRFEGVPAGLQTLTVARNGEQRPRLQVVSEAWAPWPQETGQPSAGVDVEVRYDRDALVLHESVQATAVVTLRAPRPASMLLVELAVPPGFAVVRSDWEEMVAQGLIDRYELRPGRVLVYRSNVEAGLPLTLTYQLEAELVVDVETGPSLAYDFYTPSTRGVQAPQRIVVTVE